MHLLPLSQTMTCLLLEMHMPLREAHSLVQSRGRHSRKGVHFGISGGGTTPTAPLPWCHSMSPVQGGDEVSEVSWPSLYGLVSAVLCLFGRPDQVMRGLCPPFLSPRCSLVFSRRHSSSYLYRWGGAIPKSAISWLARTADCREASRWDPGPLGEC